MWESLIKMARLEGIEPPTPGLEGRCSIQLSYRRVRHLRYTSRSRLTRLEVFLKCHNLNGGSAGARGRAWRSEDVDREPPSRPGGP